MKCLVKGFPDLLLTNQYWLPDEGIKQLVSSICFVVLQNYPPRVILCHLSVPNKFTTRVTVKMLKPAANHTNNIAKVFNNFQRVIYFNICLVIS